MQKEEVGAVRGKTRVFPIRWNRRQFIATLTAAVVAVKIKAGALAAKPREVFLVPNFHPASCGWLTTFSRERVYCANSYLNHLDRVRDDPNYSFAMSEVNNIIAIMEFQPTRIAELNHHTAEKPLHLFKRYFM